MSTSSTTFIGRLTNDPQFEMTPSGVPRAKFTIAVDRERKDADGKDQTDFWNVVVWRKTAEYVRDWRKKGDLVSVTGRMENRKYTDKNGQPRDWIELQADSLSFLAAPKGKNGESHENTAPATNANSEDEADPFAEE